MSVTFDETPISVTRDHSTSRGLASFLVRHQIAATLPQAHMLLAGTALVFFIIAGVLGYASVKGATIDTQKNFVPAIAST